MPRRTLDRRTLLRGTLGGLAISVGLPPLAAMLDDHGEALANGRPLPRRFGVFFWGNGVRLDRWVPPDVGPRYALTESLAPLAAVRDYVSVVSGMAIKTGNERGHHAGTVGILSGAPMVSQPHPTSGYASTFRAPSIDQVVANAWAGQTPFRSIELGVSRRVSENEGTTLAYLSHRGPDNPNPPEYDPGAAFDRLFGAAGAPLRAQRDKGASLLDLVGEELRALRTQVGQQDGTRLDQHLENVRALERRLANPRALCRRPGATRPKAPEEQDGKEPLADLQRSMSQVLALALSCDLVRVFSVQFSGSVAGTVFWQVGASQSHHHLTHEEPGTQPLVQAGTVFVMQQFAHLLETFAATPDGAGNLLDRSVILASTDCAQGREHSLKDYPILVAGKGGGALRHPGVHHRAVGDNTSKVLLTCLRAVGLRKDRFGMAGGEVTDSCTGIEASPAG